MKHLWVRLAYVCLLIAAIAVPTDRFEAAKRYTLAYKMDRGASFAMEVAKKHRNERNVMGNDMITNSEDLKAYGFTVKSSDKDGMRLELEYAKRAHESDDPQIQTDPDFSELIGKKVEMLLSPVGVSSGFEGFEDLPVIAIPDQDDRLDEKRYVSEVKDLFPHLPDEPVSPGDSWSHVEEHEESIGDAALPVVIEYTYTLIEETRIDDLDCVKIEGEYTVKISGSFDVGGLELELNLAGNGEETVYFAWKKGMLVSNEAHSVVEGSADNDEMGMSIQMKHDIETVTKLSLD
jgi:hypothetical protein